MFGHSKQFIRPQVAPGLSLLTSAQNCKGCFFLGSKRCSKNVKIVVTDVK